MWTYPDIIAHRGGGILAPENTLAGLQCGLNWGFHAVEFDVMLTKDQIAVLMHDEFLGRTVQGQGKIAEIMAADLFLMDAGAWFDPAFSDCRVPSFLSVMEFCALHGIWMNVEIKPSHGTDMLTGQLIGQLAEEFYGEISHAVAIPPLFSSFSVIALQAARLAAPAIARALLVERIPVDWQKQLEELDAVALHVNHRYLTQELAIAIKQTGIGLCCYTVNSLARADELRSWGVDAFCTDRLDLFAAGFEQ